MAEKSPALDQRKPNCRPRQNMPPRRRRDGRLIFVTGSRGSGKSGWTRQAVGDRTQLLVWDALKEWSRDGIVRPVRSLAELHHITTAYIRCGARETFRCGYIGPVTKPAFKTFCKLAFVWMKACQHFSKHELTDENCAVLVVEELADVTDPGKAPEGWGEVSREGRHFSGDIYALTQRPAESDKTVAGNCDIIHAGRQSFPRDRKTMAEYLDVPVKEITSLKSLHWIERDMRDRSLTRGVLEFRRSRRR